MTLPQNIGSRIRIPTWHLDLRGWVERRGYFPERGDTQNLIMRRDLGDTRLKVDEEPICPADAALWVEVL